LKTFEKEVVGSSRVVVNFVIVPLRIKKDDSRITKQEEEKR